MYPLLSIVYICPPRNSNLKIIDSSVHYLKIALNQIHSIHRVLINSQTLTYLSRTIAQILQFVTLNISDFLHKIDSSNRLNSPNQNSLRLSFQPSNNIQTNICDHVNRIDVEMTSVKPKIFSFLSFFV